MNYLSIQVTNCGLHMVSTLVDFLSDIPGGTMHSFCQHQLTFHIPSSSHCCEYIVHSIMRYWQDIGYCVERWSMNGKVGLSIHSCFTLGFLFTRHPNENYRSRLLRSTNKLISPPTKDINSNKLPSVYFSIGLIICTFLVFCHYFYLELRLAKL